MLGFGKKNKNNKENLVQKWLAKFSSDTSVDHNPDEIKQTSIGFIFVLITDDQHELYNDALSKIINITLQNKGTIMEIVSSLVLIGFNLPTAENTEQENAGQLRSNTVNFLIDELNESVRILHGEVEAAVGAFGNKALSSYTAFIPGFDKYLLKLASLDNGEQLSVN